MSHIDEWPTIRQVSEKSGLSRKTIRRYAAAGVYRWVRDPMGVIHCEPGAAEKARARYLAHGAPGGRSVAV